MPSKSKPAGPAGELDTAAEPTDLRLDELRSFVSVARHLHFTHAADELGLPQTVVSRHVRRLEERFGATLLRRTTRAVELTGSGATLLRAAERILSETARVQDDLFRVERGELGSLRLGHVASAAIHLVPTALQEFRAAFPAVRIGLQEGFDDSLIDGVRSGNLDVAFTRSSHVRNDLEAHPVGPRDAVCAVLPTGHALANRKRITMDQLRASGVMVWPRSLDAIERNMVEASFSRSGFDITFNQPHVSAMTVLSLVALGAGVGLLAEPFAELGWPGVRLVPISGKWSQLHVVSRAEDDNPVVANFVEVASHVKYRPVGV